MTNTTEVPVLNEWQRGRKELNAKKSEVVASLAKALGAKTVYRGKGVVEEWENFPDILLANGRTLIVNVDFEKRRATVSGLWPKAREGGTSPESLNVVKYNETYQREISFSLDKTPERQARDIENRFLPTYNDLYEKCLVQVGKNNDFDQARKNTFKELAAVAGVKGCRPGDEFSIYETIGNSYCKVNVSSADSVTLEIRSLPKLFAVEILKILKGRNHDTALGRF